jgi:hypothetical protein
MLRKYTVCVIIVTIGNQMKKLLVLAILGAMSATATAADLGGSMKDSYIDVTPQCAGVSWTGLRIGGLVGVGMTGIGSGDGTMSGQSIDTKDHTAPLNTSGAYQMSTVGQLEIGGDWQFKNSPIVIGAFGDLGYGSGTAEMTYSVNGRVGVAVGNALFYGFGGYEKAHVVHDMTNLSSGDYIATLKADPAGLVYGVGVDIALTSHWYVGLRAERADYGSLTAKGSASGVDYVANVSGTDDRGLVTVGYKF